MQKLIFCLASFLLIKTVNAQMDAVIYSEAGEKFTVYLNGDQMNDLPKSNVKMKGLTSEFYQCRIDFENNSIPDLSTKTFACHQGMEVTYTIKQNKKGEYVLRYFTENPISNSSASGTSNQENPNKQFAVADDPQYQNSPNGSTGTGNPSTASGSNAGSAGVNMTVTSSGNSGSVGMNISATDGTTGNGNVNVNISANDGKNGAGSVNMNITANDGNVNSGSVSMNINADGTNMGMNVSGTSTQTNSNSASNQNTASNSSPGSTDKIVTNSNNGCIRSMDNNSFGKAVESVKSKGFDDSKLTSAKQIIRANCFTSEQIKAMMTIFGFEETKLDFAKFAYDYCFDVNNYFLVNDAFTFDSTKDELNEYLQTK